ncbi:MAG: DUF368 domain-containing protein [Candidatus Azotimanducaceae bacterium]|uniref:DUF368 domain-containing protein n=1 Tax=OM182 bacterium TaxID=2510334 RepID=A0A520S0M0_9GAMM|nr:DUF368 domain-containing protein [Gammaproteobacteria bacterium]OUV68061.1 MAG: hypothetical protein CBC93_03565 [Gammaproteobacteria bacterium TMED133]RZO76019.1 MAG: DUF368 domain-containing protein [OM182 bacterium]
MKHVCIGFLMGAVEVLPGVSGGTIAFISGIYLRLLNALKRFNPKLIIDIYNMGFRIAWKSLDISFLTSLFLGMGIGIILFANIMSFFLQNEPVILWSFFFGLVLASCILIIRDTDMRIIQTYIFLGIGLVAGLTMTQLVSLDIEPTPIALFFGGVFSVCAWILPGVSGSFFLLIFGLYSFVIDAIKSFDLISLSSLGVGCVIGIVSFSQMLSFLLIKYRNTVLSVLVGLMLGCLTRVWPWKNTLSYQLANDGSHIPLVQEAVLPSTYILLTNQDADVLAACVAVLIGMASVTIFHFINLRSSISYD